MDRPVRNLSRQYSSLSRPKRSASFYACTNLRDFENIRSAIWRSSCWMLSSSGIPGPAIKSFLAGAGELDRLEIKNIGLEKQFLDAAEFWSPYRNLHKASKAFSTVSTARIIGTKS